MGFDSLLLLMSGCLSGEKFDLFMIKATDADSDGAEGMASVRSLLAVFCHFLSLERKVYETGNDEKSSV